MLAAIDFGLSNMKIVYASAHGEVLSMHCRPALRHVDVDAVRAALAVDGHRPEDFKVLVMTGGRSAGLPDFIDATPLHKVSEIEAIGRGGLLAAGSLFDAALVVSCGSGTAAIAVRPGDVHHTSGTAVGGGTLCGLGQLLLGIADAVEIDTLSSCGNATVLDLTLQEATHGPLGAIPPDATAVNFGKAAEAARRGVLERADVAASLVTMIAQTVALVAIGAARTEKLERIVLVGRLPSLPAVATQLLRTAQFYGANFTIPAEGVFAPVRGALAAAISRRNWR
ncbi:MAG: Fumble domain-containing protein [Chloroflexi bacterium]|nr:Fumble domain-containing protein [Chloroflexota bacterium]